MKEGWEIKKLGEVCTIERGGSPRPIKAYITEEETGLNWIKIGDTDPGGKYILSTKEKIIPSGLKKSRWVEENDFLLSNSMSFGRPYILKTNGCIHDGWLVLRNYQSFLNIDFFYYLLSSPYVQQQFRQKAQGSTVSNLNTQRVADSEIPVPPMDEQLRIVKILDDAFAKIDKLKANAQKNLANAKALFQATLKKELTPKPDWQTLTMKDASGSINYGTSCPSNENGKYKYLRMNNITNEGRLDLSHYKTIDLPEKELSKCIVEKGDILFNRTNSRELVGKSCVFISEEPMVIAGYIIRIKLKKGFNPHFVNFILNFQRETGMFKHLIIGAVHQANISAKNIQKITFSYPDLEEQGRIVSILDSIFQKVLILSQKNISVIAECDALRQSILRKAFNGEL